MHIIEAQMKDICFVNNRYLGKERIPFTRISPVYPCFQINLCFKGLPQQIVHIPSEKG